MRSGGVLGTPKKYPPLDWSTPPDTLIWSPPVACAATMPLFVNTPPEILIGPLSDWTKLLGSETVIVLPVPLREISPAASMDEPKAPIVGVDGLLTDAEALPDTVKVVPAETVPPMFPEPETVLELFVTLSTALELDNAMDPALASSTPVPAETVPSLVSDTVVLLTVISPVLLNNAPVALTAVTLPAASLVREKVEPPSVVVPSTITEVPCPAPIAPLFAPEKVLVPACEKSPETSAKTAAMGPPEPTLRAPVLVLERANAPDPVSEILVKGINAGDDGGEGGEGGGGGGGGGGEGGDGEAA